MDNITNIKFIFAVGHQISVILNTEDKFILEEIDELGPTLDDWGIDNLPLEKGIYLWEGKATLEFLEGYVPKYEGTYKLLYSLERGSYG